MGWIGPAVVSIVALCQILTGHLSATTSIVRHGTNAVPLDGDGKYIVDWELGSDGESITFNVMVQTTGYVGFGISPNGDMRGSDVVIGGVHTNGTIYFSDRHVIGYSEPVVDEHQNWDLLSGGQNGTHTWLTFSRQLDTCDSDDLPITTDTARVIWSYGVTDDTSVHHGGNRGAVSVNLLDPPMPPFDSTGLDVWTLTMNATMPTQETTYWCSMHKSPPRYTASRQAVGFDIRLPTPKDVKHTHHLVVFRCFAPAGQSPEDVFGQYIGQDGGDCFRDAPYTQFHHMCRNPIYAWAVGGQLMALPDDIGLPITQEGKTEYIMIEMHYDNPDIEDGVRVTSLLDVYSTSEPRPIQAQVGVLMTDMNFSHIIPPNQEAYVTVAHCSFECTADMIPPTGTFIFNILLHSHKAGRKMKFRHWRDGVELPWIISDEHYDFDFQQNRPLKEPRQVLPGDHLALECTTDTRGRGNNITIAGYGTLEEMCQVIFYTYPSGTWGSCNSRHDQSKFLERFGIEAVRWNDLVLEPPTITAPSDLAETSLLDFLNTRVNWTPQLVADLQRDSRFTQHEQACARQLIHPTYPDVEEYAPETTCREDLTTTTTMATTRATTMSTTTTTESSSSIFSMSSLIFFHCVLVSGLFMLTS